MSFTPNITKNLHDSIVLQLNAVGFFITAVMVKGSDSVVGTPFMETQCIRRGLGASH
jgi:hypothetical protein